MGFIPKVETPLPGLAANLLTTISIHRKPTTPLLEKEFALTADSAQ
jgi:hypothetical protein